MIPTIGLCEYYIFFNLKDCDNVIVYHLRYINVKFDGNTLFCHSFTLYLAEIRISFSSHKCHLSKFGVAALILTD